jgi:Endosomal/lysosomal potassium channel TMEM175
LRAPQGTEPRSLLPTLPAFATFALSFILIGIYWNNYHHMLRASRGVDGRVKGANLHLLFWLSLVPFATAWLGQNPSAVAPTVVYAHLVLLCGRVRHPSAITIAHQQHRCSVRECCRNRHSGATNRALCGCDVYDVHLADRRGCLSHRRGGPVAFPIGLSGHRSDLKTRFVMRFATGSIRYRPRGTVRRVRVRCDQRLRGLALKLSLRAPITNLREPTAAKSVDRGSD